jgi:small subunit ribosomal protein S2
MRDITIKEFVNAGVHFGHHSSRWNPKMFPYIFRRKKGTHVIDLVQTSSLLKLAYDYVQIAAKKKKTFLFIGTKRQASDIIAKEAKKCGAHYVSNRWLGGILTNWSTVRSRVNYLKKLDKKEISGKIALLPKKEAAFLRRKYDKLDYNLGGLRKMRKIPDVVIVVDPKRESTAIEECRKLRIKIVSILDTNCDPDLVDLAIPANDDSVDSIELIISTLASGILVGSHS